MDRPLGNAAHWCSKFFYLKHIHWVTGRYAMLVYRQGQPHSIHFSEGGLKRALRFCSEAHDASYMGLLFYGLHLLR